MANVTIAIDRTILHRARVRATEQGTSVNALVAAYLAEYAEGDPAADALAAFFDLADQAAAGSGPAGRQWTREDLHDRSHLR